jgi:nucleoside-diphosphate-sugar epimerase
VLDVVADYSKIMKELNWRPKFDIDEGLKAIVEKMNF